MVEDEKTDEQALAAAPQKKTKKKETPGSLLRFLLGLAVFAWILRSLIVAPFSIPSGSMLPTMWIGDYLFVAKWDYGYSRYSFPLGIPSFDGRLFSDEAERGDIVVFRPPGQENADFVKRVIGLPGDRIEVRGGNVVLNGETLPRQRLERDFALPMTPNSPCRVVPGGRQFIQQDAAGGRICLYPVFRETLPGGRSYLVLDQVAAGPADERGPITVPEGHYFLMGDNRDDSLDSRFEPVTGGVGFVPHENLVGRAIGNFWSTDGSATWYLPWTWFTALRPGRIGVSYGG